MSVMEFLKVTNSTDGFLAAPNRWCHLKISIKMQLEVYMDLIFIW